MLGRQPRGFRAVIRGPRRGVSQVGGQEIAHGVAKSPVDQPPAPLTVARVQPPPGAKGSRVQPEKSGDFALINPPPRGNVESLSVAIHIYTLPHLRYLVNKKFW